MKSFFSFLVAGCLLVAPGARASTATSQRMTVSIDKFMFAPMEITIAPGTTVVWINHDQTPHTIAARDHAYVSPAMDTDDRYERQFTAEGDFSYVCSLHPFMTGIVHVRSSRPSSGSAGPGH